MLLARSVGRSVLLYPFMEGNGDGRALFRRRSASFVLALVVWRFAASPAMTWVRVMLALPSTVLGDQAGDRRGRCIPYSSAFEAVL